MQPTLHNGMAKKRALPAQVKKPDLRERMRAIAALREKFAEEMAMLRKRQRTLMNKVVTRLDGERAERLRKAMEKQV